VHPCRIKVTVFSFDDDESASSDCLVCAAAEAKAGCWRACRLVEPFAAPALKPPATAAESAAIIKKRAPPQSGYLGAPGITIVLLSWMALESVVRRDTNGLGERRRLASLFLIPSVKYVERTKNDDDDDAYTSTTLTHRQPQKVSGSEEDRDREAKTNAGLPFVKKSV